MNAQIRILTGARAGVVLTFSQEMVTIGRHPAVDLQFSPANDLEVSAHHAALLRRGDRWFVRDLGSRNGTFVNGQRISADTLLREGDRIAFGRQGPAATFGMLAPGSGGTGAVATAARDHGPLRPTSGPASAPRELSSSDRFRIAVAFQTRRLRRLSLGLALILAVVISGFLYARHRERAGWEQERAVMHQRIDSVLAASDETVRALEGQLEGLANALRVSQQEVREARIRLERAQARGENAETAVLRRRLQDATATLARQQLAAGLDFRSIQRENRPAVAVIYVESETGEVSTATAFAVRANATLLTSRHVVAGADGRQRPRRIAIQFSDSEQIWPARILAVSAEADLALVKVDNILGDVPTVRSLNLRPDTLDQGSPVVLIGFPLGADMWTPGSAQSGRMATPLLSAGIISGLGSDRLEIQGYGAAGASGSPIFDANGEVIAVLFGGLHNVSPPTLLGVPASAVARLLATAR